MAGHDKINKYYIYTCTCFYMFYIQIYFMTIRGFMEASFLILCFYKAVLLIALSGQALSHVT